MVSEQLIHLEFFGAVLGHEVFQGGFFQFFDLDIPDISHQGQVVILCPPVLAQIRRPHIFNFFVSG